MAINESVTGNQAVFEETFRSFVKREGVDELLDWLTKETDFFTAPASTRFHGSYAGGLCEHSFNVYNALMILYQVFINEHPSKEELEKIAIVSLLHDVCKTNLYKIDYKNQKTYDQEKVNAAIPYEVKKDAQGEFIWEKVPYYTHDDQFPYGHGEKSVYLISKFMELTDEEAMAIRFHMGAWQDGEKQNAGAAFNKYQLAALLHLADMTATYITEKRGD